MSQESTFSSLVEVQDQKPHHSHRRTMECGKTLDKMRCIDRKGVRNLEKKRGNSTTRQSKQCSILHSKEKREKEGQNNKSKYIQANCLLHRNIEGRETATVVEKNSDRKKERIQEKEELNQKKEEKISQDISIESKGSFQRDRKEKNLDEINKELKKGSKTYVFLRVTKEKI